MRKKTRLIAALDVTDRSKALSISREIEFFVDAIKVGYPLVLESGLGVIGMIAEFAPATRPESVRDLRRIVGNMSIISTWCGSTGGKCSRSHKGWSGSCYSGKKHL